MHFSNYNFSYLKLEKFSGLVTYKKKKILRQLKKSKNLKGDPELLLPLQPRYKIHLIKLFYFLIIVIKGQLKIFLFLKKKEKITAWKIAFNFLLVQSSVLIHKLSL